MAKYKIDLELHNKLFTEDGLRALEIFQECKTPIDVDRAVNAFLGAAKANLVAIVNGNAMIQNWLNPEIAHKTYELYSKDQGCIAGATKLELQC